MKIELIREQARGRWLFILQYHDITVPMNKRQGPCPVPMCGGTDRFRFDDLDGRGTWFCRQCIPNAGDGFALLMKVKGWSFPQAMEAVAAVRRISQSTPPPEPRPTLATVKNTPPNGTVGVDLFVYQDAAAQPVIFVKRTDRSEGGKSFCQSGQTLDHTGWQRNLQHAPKPRPLYHLPAIIASTDADIVFHEGEKATDAAIAAGLPGVHVTTLGGAGNPHHPDNDSEGLEYATAVKRLALEAGALRVNVLQLPGLPPKGDVVEWLAAGGTSAQFSALLQENRASISSGPSGPDGPSPVPERTEALVSQQHGPGPGGPVLALVQSEGLERRGDRFGLNAIGPADFPPVQGYRIEKHGVYELANSEDKPNVRLTLAPCGVGAHSRDGHHENWGALLLWLDRDGTRHDSVYPIGRFHESGGTLPAELANLGLPIVPDMERRLLRFLGQSIPKTRLRAATQTGWQEDFRVFVLPGEIIGEATTDECVVYQPERFSVTRQSVRTRGTLSGWQTDIAAKCAGNPVLVFSISASLAAPLLHGVGQEGGGFHYSGPTSGGKTTALQTAASSWGDASDPAGGRSTAFVKKWNLTKNATEGLAEAHTDLPLCLDEVGEADAREFGRMVYQLAGGQGKGRMRADATLMPSKVWRIVLLSTGELRASDVIESEGKAVKGGQAIRLIDIPATDPITGHGIIVDTHGDPTAACFVDGLKRSCSTHYGWAGPVFIRALIREGLTDVHAALKAALEETAQALTPANASAEVQRAVKKFALVAVAGEKAVSLKILPWMPGEALRSTKVLLSRYLAARGGAGSQLEQAVEQIRSFLLAHCSSRFRDLGSDSDRTINLAGYQDATRAVFYFTPGGFKEACRGHNYQDVARLLAARGFLIVPDAGHFTERVNVPGLGRVRLYAVSADILDGASFDRAEDGSLDRSTK